MRTVCRQIAPKLLQTLKVFIFVRPYTTKGEALECFEFECKIFFDPIWNKVRPMNVEGLSMAAIVEMLLLRFSILPRLTHAELSNTTEAISSYKKFISIDILTLGENHLDISRVRFIVGQLCHNNNDLEGAFEHFLTLALKASRTTVGGPDDDKLGNVIYDQNNMKAALDFYEEGLTVERQIYLVCSQNISLTLMNIAGI